MAAKRGHLNQKSISQSASLGRGTPKEIKHPGSNRILDGDTTVAWRFELIQQEPCFGWDTLTEEHRIALHQKLIDFEKQTVNELFQGGNPGKTYCDPRSIPNDVARERFIERYGDEDEVHRLRCGGKPRIYCIRRRNILFLLWWDPDHVIWPTDRG